MLEALVSRVPRARGRLEVDGLLRGLIDVRLLDIGLPVRIVTVVVVVVVLVAVAHGRELKETATEKHSARSVLVGNLSSLKTTPLGGWDLRVLADKMRICILVCPSCSSEDRLAFDR